MKKGLLCIAHSHTRASTVIRRNKAEECKQHNCVSSKRSLDQGRLLGCSGISRNSAGDGTAPVTDPPVSRALSLIQRMKVCHNTKQPTCGCTCKVICLLGNLHKINSVLVKENNTLTHPMALLHLKPLFVVLSKEKQQRN